jgi:hypothetical protein
MGRPHTFSATSCKCGFSSVHRLFAHTKSPPPALSDFVSLGSGSKLESRIHPAETLFSGLRFLELALYACRHSGIGAA